MEKCKTFLKKNGGKIILGLTAVGSVVLNVVLYGKNQKIRGEVSNLRDSNLGLQKTVERQSYIIGKQNQKLYGGGK